jgi:hypothetical protein
MSDIKWIAEGNKQYGSVPLFLSVSPYIQMNAVYLS